MEEETAVEVLRALGQKPAMDLTNGQYAMDVPKYLIGTPTGEMLGIMREEAYEVGLYVRRDWKGLRWGGIATYSLWRGAEKLMDCVVDGPEGKTARSKAYKQLAEMHQKVRDVHRQVCEDDLMPTVPLFGDYVLRDADRDALWKLGAFYHPRRQLWLSPTRNHDAVRAILTPRSGMHLGARRDFRYEHLAPLATVPNEDLCYVTPGNSYYHQEIYIVAAHQTQINAVFVLAGKA